MEGRNKSEENFIFLVTAATRVLGASALQLQIITGKSWKKEMLYCKLSKGESFKKCFVNPLRSIYLIKPLIFDGGVFNLHKAWLEKLNVEHSQSWLVTTDTGLMWPHTCVLGDIQKIPEFRILPCLHSLPIKLIRPNCSVMSKTTQIFQYSFLCIFYVSWFFVLSLYKSTKETDTMDETLNTIYLW